MYLRREHTGVLLPGADPQCDAGWLGELAARVAEGALADRLMDKAELGARAAAHTLLRARGCRSQEVCGSDSGK